MPTSSRMRLGRRGAWPGKVGIAIFVIYRFFLSCSIPKAPDDGPPRPRLCTEELLHLIDPGPLVRNQLHDFMRNAQSVLGLGSATNGPGQKDSDTEMERQRQARLCQANNQRGQTRARDAGSQSAAMMSDTATPPGDLSQHAPYPSREDTVSRAQ